MDNKSASVQCDYPAIFSNYSLKVRNGNVKCSESASGLLLQMLVEMKTLGLNLYYVYDNCNTKGSRHTYILRVHF